MGPVAGHLPTADTNNLFALVRATARLIMSALAPSTVAAYNRTLLHFRQFLLSLTPRYQPFPANAGHVALYITHLHLSGMAPATIVSKLSAISFVHKMCNRPDPTTSFLVSKLTLALKKANPQRDMCVPITVDMLHEILQNLHRFGFSLYQKI